MYIYIYIYIYIFVFVSINNFVHTLWIVIVSFLHDFCGILHLSNDKYFALGSVRDSNKLGSQRL